jgi:pimeloyl-ACP methyl ester carboxylesterase
MQDVGVIDSHPGVLYDAYARSSAVSGLCTSAYTDNQTESGVENGLLSFVGTTSVARDMLEILNKGGWGKLRYWGFSYGTILGGMFAAMYPDRVDRLVSDGMLRKYFQDTNYKFSSLLTNVNRERRLHRVDIMLAS